MLLALFVLPALIATHKLAAGAIAWVVFMAIIDGMPPPTPTSSVWYRWLHGSLNLLAGNLFRVLTAIFPKFAAVFAPQVEDLPANPSQGRLLQMPPPRPEKPWQMA